jgi:hypothetical protein
MISSSEGVTTCDDMPYRKRRGVASSAPYQTQLRRLHSRFRFSKIGFYMDFHMNSEFMKFSQPCNSGIIKGRTDFALRTSMDLSRFFSRFCDNTLRDINLLLWLHLLQPCLNFFLLASFYLLNKWMFNRNVHLSFSSFKT